MRLLIIEDNDHLRSSLAKGLASVGYTVTTAADGRAGWELAREAVHDLLILDRMLPELDGLEILRRLRAAGSQVPVLLLTARDTAEDTVAGLDAGADDYLTKPFAVAVLLARIRTLLRRRQHRSDPVIRLGGLEIDTAAKIVRCGPRRLDLTPREYTLLEVLLARHGGTISRAELADQLYGTCGEADVNALDVLVGRLRRKLHAPGQPAVLHTRRGFGYLLAADGTHDEAP